MVRQPIWIMVVITIVLFSAARYAGAGSAEPPAGAERINGPAIQGVLVATTDGISVAAVIVGNCKKMSVAFGPITLTTVNPATMAGATSDDVLDMRLRGAGPIGCYSDFGGEDLIITGVTNFNNTGSALGADIAIQHVTAK